MSRVDPRLEDYVRTGVLTGQVDRQLVASARTHGLLGVVFDEVHSTGITTSKQLKYEIAAHRLTSIQDITHRIDVLERVQQQLDGSCRLGLAKGLATALQWYPTPWSRSGSDLDVYFDPAGTSRLGEMVALIDPQTPDAQLLNSLAAGDRNFEHSLILDGVRLDIHHDIMNLMLPTKQMHCLWDEHSVELEVRDGLTVWTLDHELSLVLSILNATRDGFASLKTFLDIRLMMDAEPEWAAIERFVRAEGWYPIVSNGLEVVCDVLERPNPLRPTRFWHLVHSELSPRRLDLRARETKAYYSRRQAFICSMLDKRRIELVRSLIRRVFPQRALIDARSPGARGPYPLALLTWRRQQRRRIRRRRLSHSAH